MLAESGGMKIPFLFRRRPAPTASDHARALGQIGRDADRARRDADRARRLAMARELCRCTGQTIPAILNDKDA